MNTPGLATCQNDLLAYFRMVMFMLSVFGIATIYWAKPLIRELLQLLSGKIHKISLRLFSGYIARKRQNPTIKVRKSRKTFQGMAFSKGKVDEKHSHGESASERNAATRYARDFAKRLGLAPFSVQKSNNDERSRIAGSRSYYWAKDTSVDACSEDSEGKLKYIIDSEYYMKNLGEELVGSTLPTIIYTLAPTTAANCKGDSPFTFCDDGDISMHVSGGSYYKHPLWDYTCDTICVTKTFLGVPYAATVMAVDSKMTSAHKKLVCLTPIGTWTGLAAIAVASLDSSRLQRMQPVRNGWTMIKVSRKEGLFYSVARTGSYAEATVSAGTFDRMCTAHRMSKTGSNTNSVSTWANSESDGKDDAKERSVIICEFIREMEGTHGPYICPVEEGVIYYTCSEEVNEDPKVGISPFMTPIVMGGAWSPLNDQENGDWAVESRITDLTRDEPLRLTPFVKTCVEEFIGFVTKGFSPVCKDFDDIWAKQDRPAQRAILTRAGIDGPGVTDTIKSFIKRESYGGAKAPRVISTVPGVTKLEYSCYTVSASECIKEQPWYAFKTPKEISDRVVEITHLADEMVETDFSRMDGHVCNAVREHLEVPFMTALFGEDEHMLELMGKQHSQHGKLGSKSYDSGFARASGSPETSLFNTLLTANISYLTHRKLGETPEQAYAALGVYGGDDGLDRKPDGVSGKDFAKAYENSAVSWGQKLTLETKKFPEPVSFLARYYGGAWMGDSNSCCDILRQLAKIHTCVKLDRDVTAEQKAVEKASAILLTDANTPIIGAIAAKIIGKHGTSKALAKSALRATRTWWSNFDSCDQYPNEGSPWMEELAHNQMPYFNWEHFSDWVENGDPMRMPVCLEVEPGKMERDVRFGTDPTDLCCEAKATKKDIEKVHRKAPSVKKTGSDAGSHQSRSKTTRRNNAEPTEQTPSPKGKGTERSTKRTKASRPKRVDVRAKPSPRTS